MASKHLERVRRQQEEQRQFRVGASVLGMFAGLAVGLLLAYLLVRVRVTTEVSPLLVFGGAVVGGGVGFLHAASGLNLFEAVAHYVIGYFAAAHRLKVRPRPRTPGWLRLALLAGIVCGIVVVTLFRHRRHWYG